MRPKTVLIVDDEKAVRETMRLLLELQGYQVLTAEDGSAALRALDGSGADVVGVIILDLMMPVMDGWHFLQEKSKVQSLAPIPVLIVSAASPENVQLAHGDGYLRKPFEVDDLLNAVQRHCA